MWQMLLSIVKPNFQVDVYVIQKQEHYFVFSFVIILS